MSGSRPAADLSATHPRPWGSRLSRDIPPSRRRAPPVRPLSQDSRQRGTLQTTSKTRSFSRTPRADHASLEGQQPMSGSRFLRSHSAPHKADKSRTLFERTNDVEVPGPTRSMDRRRGSRHPNDPETTILQSLYSMLADLRARIDCLAQSPPLPGQAYHEWLLAHDNPSSCCGNSNIRPVAVQPESRNVSDAPLLRATYEKPSSAYQKTTLHFSGIHPSPTTVPYPSSTGQEPHSQQKPYPQSPIARLASTDLTAALEQRVKQTQVLLTENYPDIFKDD
jgi:hypothetical protein